MSISIDIEVEDSTPVWHSYGRTDRLSGREASAYSPAFKWTNPYLYILGWRDRYGNVI